MAPDLVQIYVLAQAKEEENWEFRQFLKHQCRLGSSEIDKQVIATTKRIWAGIDCTQCANCCREVTPTFSEEEVNRLAVRLGMTRQKLIDAHLERAEDGDGNPWQTRTKPCPFLKNNRCSVYEDRPGDCRGYPYLDEPDFAFRTMGMIERTFTCPIVYEVMEELKPSLGFSRKRRR
jgi:hypothetical protein